MFVCQNKKTPKLNGQIYTKVKLLKLLEKQEILNRYKTWKEVELII